MTNWTIAQIQRISQRYTRMTDEERAEERTHQRSIMNSANVDSHDFDVAVSRLDILDMVEGKMD